MGKHEMHHRGLGSDLGRLYRTREVMHRVRGHLVGKGSFSEINVSTASEGSQVGAWPGVSGEGKGPSCGAHPEAGVRYPVRKRPSIDTKRPNLKSAAGGELVDCISVVQHYRAVQGQNPVDGLGQSVDRER